MADTLASVLKTEPEWMRLPSELHPVVARLLKRCLVKDRHARLADISSARFDLRDAAEAPVPVTTGRTRNGSNYSALKWIGGALAAALLLGVSASRLLRSEQALPQRWVELSLPALRNEDATTTYLQSSFALSPDGQSIAFSSVSDRRSGCVRWKPEQRHRYEAQTVAAFRSGHRTAGRSGLNRLRG